MAIPSSRSINYDALLSLTLENVRPGLFDNIFSSNAFLAALYGSYGKKKKKGKGVKMLSGGERIRVPLMYGKNTTAKSYSGYETLDTTPQDGITTAFYQWRQMAVSITISGEEEMKNQGEAAIRSLLADKIEQAQMSLYEEVSYQLMGKTVSSGVWSAGNNSKDLDPLPHLVPKDPTGSVSVGNINQNTYSWWRSKSVDGSAAHGAKDAGAERGFLCDDWATLFSAMRYTYNACARHAGNGQPDLIVTDQLGYESYEGGLDSRSRIVNDSNGPVSVGFDSVRFKGANMIWEPFMPDIDGGYVYSSSNWSTSTMQFLNLDYLELCMHSKRDFVTTPFMRPENQDAKTAQILMMGNLTCSNRRTQGILYGITAPITA